MNRERPIIGDRRKPSALGDIQPDHWLAEYTTELLNVLHVLTLLVDLEPNKPNIWRRSVLDPSSPSFLDTTDDTDDIVWEPGKPWLISADELRACGALDVPAEWRMTLSGGERNLFSEPVEDTEEQGDQ